MWPIRKKHKTFIFGFDFDKSVFKSEYNISVKKTKSGNIELSWDDSEILVEVSSGQTIAKYNLKPNLFDYGAKVVKTYESYQYDKDTIIEFDGQIKINGSLLFYNSFFCGTCEMSNPVLSQISYLIIDEYKEQKIESSYKSIWG